MRSILILLLMLTACSAGSEPPVENPAPDFELDLHAGGSWKLSDALGSGPVLLDFWATWCAPCKLTMPHVQALADEYGDRGLQVVTISEDHPNQHGKIDPFFEDAGLRLPVLLDSQRKVGAKYQVQMLPTSVLIDARGGIVARHVGYQQGQEKELAAQIQALIEGTSIPSPGAGE
jgi:peroxiredoxin